MICQHDSPDWVWPGEDTGVTHESRGDTASVSVPVSTLLNIPACHECGGTPTWDDWNAMLRERGCT